MGEFLAIDLFDANLLKFGVDKPVLNILKRKKGFSEEQRLEISKFREENMGKITFFKKFCKKG